MSESWEIVLGQLVSTLPSDIEQRRRILVAAMDVVPKTTAIAAELRELLSSLDSHILNQREFSFPRSVTTSR